MLEHTEDFLDFRKLRDSRKQGWPQNKIVEVNAKQEKFSQHAEEKAKEIKI